MRLRLCQLNVVTALEDDDRLSIDLENGYLMFLRAAQPLHVVRVEDARVEDRLYLRLGTISQSDVAGIIDLVSLLTDLEVSIIETRGKNLLFKLKKTRANPIP